MSQLESLIMSLLAKMNDILYSKALHSDLTGKIKRVYKDCKEHCISVFKNIDVPFDINYTDMFGRSFLIMATIINDIEMVDSILEKNPNIDYVSKTFHTALIMAVKIGSIDMCKTLIAHGADVNVFDNFKKPALVYAKKFGHNEIYRILIDAGANIHIGFDDTILYLSCCFQKLELGIHLTELDDQKLIVCINEYDKIASKVSSISVI